MKNKKQKRSIPVLIVNLKIRLWRKNRGSKYYEWQDGKQRCQGVDLNRNFAFHFGGNTFVKSHLYLYICICSKHL